MSIFHNALERLQDTCYIWWQEMKLVFKDEGVIIFFFLVPLVYPLLYSWIYNNETVHEVPVAVVDDAHTSLSRQFIRMTDASPDVKIAFYAQDLDEAKSLVSRQLVKGIYYIPADFDTNINRLQQATISVYCDMSLMLAYKAIFQTAQLVSMQMGTELKTKLGQHYTAREEAIAAKPLDVADVPIFNPSGGYGSFILPGVLMLILQQTLVLGIGLSAGTARENNRYGMLIPINRHYHNMFRIVMGKALCYFMIYAVMGAWLVAAVPRMFHFPQLASATALLALMLPYILACIFFGMTVSCLVRYRENVMLLMVFVSIPLLFLTGVSWPQSSIPGLWQGISWLFPSTFGVRAYVRLNSMGATLQDVLPELRILWVHVVVYFGVACAVYRYQIHMARNTVRNRLSELKGRKARLLVLPLLCICLTSTAQNDHKHHRHEHPTDSTDVFFRHLKLNELVVAGVTGETKLKHSTAPITVVSGKELRQTASTNLIDALSRQPGVAQVTTGSGISKPIIRGLGYNRIVVMNEGVRQEGQQWGDEHGIEIDAANVNSAEILKGPASLMYGSDAMAGVLILNSAPILPEGELKASLSSEYQTNNGLFDYSLNVAGNHKGFVWDARFSDKNAHAYKNKYDGYVPGTQFGEGAGRLMLGLYKPWGHSRLTWTAFHQTPSIAEGERDEVTGLLESTTDNVKTYSKALPFQDIKHYKAVWENSLNLPKGWLKAVVGYQQNRRKEFEESADDYELFFKLHTVTYDFHYLTQDFNGWKLAAGLGGMWQQSLNLGEETLIPEYRLFDVGGYATVTKSLENLTLSGGIRYDQRHLSSPSFQLSGLSSPALPAVSSLKRDFHGATGSLGAVWNVCKHTNLRLNVARGFRAPNMSELGSDGVHEGTVRYEIGNPDLKSEYSWQADLGIDFSSRYLSAQLSLFANRIENYIFAKRISQVVEQGYRTYQYTQGDARLLGFEAGFDLHPIHSLHLGNAFSFVDARQLNVDETTRYLPMTPAPRWTSELKYEFTHHGHSALDNAYLALGMECNLAQNHYYKADNTETRTPSYTLFSLSAGTDLAFRHKKVAEISLTVDNLFNRAYQNHLSRLKYGDMNNVTNRQGVYNMGRNVVVKLLIPISARL